MAPATKPSSISWTSEPPTFFSLESLQESYVSFKQKKITRRPLKLRVLTTRIELQMATVDSHIG